MGLQAAAVPMPTPLGQDLGHNSQPCSTQLNYAILYLAYQFLTLHLFVYYKVILYMLAFYIVWNIIHVYNLIIIIVTDSTATTECVLPVELQIAAIVKLQLYVEGMWLRQCPSGGCSVES